MNVTFYSENLKSLLTQSRQFIGSPKDKLPILLKVKISAYDTGLVTFTTFDMTNTAVITTNANVIEDGSVVVDCQQLLAMVKSGDSELTTLNTVTAISNGETGTSLVSLTSGSLQVNLEAQDAQEFPERMGINDWQPLASYHGNQLSSVLSKLLTVASKDEARPVLMGLHFTHDKKGTLAEATDGYRLTRAMLPQAITGNEFVLPGKTARGLLTLIAPDMSVHMYQSQGFVKILVGTKAEVIAKLVEGQFPKTESIIPTTEPTAVIKANRKEFIRQLQSILKFKTDAANIVKIITDDLSIKLQGTGTSGNITLSVPAMVSGTMTIGFNAKFLLEIMKNMSGETVEIKLTDPLKPAIIEEPILTKALSIVMPVRTREEGK